MTPAEIAAAGKAFADEVGSSAYLSLSINFDNKHPLYGCVWPSGLSNSSTKGVYADDWPELFVTLREKWAEHSEHFHWETVRKMALEIIRITAEQGICTDSALRGVLFTDADVERYGPEACQDANEIAGNGPFEITELKGANAA